MRTSGSRHRGGGAPRARFLWWGAGFAVVAAVALAGWPDGREAPFDGPPSVQGLDGVVTAMADRARQQQQVVPEVPAVLTDLAPTAVPLDVPALDAPLQAKNLEKKIAKLQKKIAKTNAKIEKKQDQVAELDALVDDLESQLADAQDQLTAAEALPQSTPAEVKARNKAIKQANKLIKKLTKKLAKKNKKIDKNEGKIDTLDQKVADLEVMVDTLEAQLPVDGLPDAGEVGLSGLKAPTRMSVVATSGEGGGDGGASGILAPGSFIVPDPAVDGFPPEADYYTDPAYTFVYDPSMETLGSVNEILCMLSQTAYELMVNRGAYKAKIDEDKCGSGKGGPGGDAGKDTSSNVEQLEVWVIDSRRADADTDQFVGIWVPQEDQGGPEGVDFGANTIHVLMRVMEEPSDANPFGRFELDFASLLDDGSSDDPIFWGTLETVDVLDGYMGFEFFQQESDPEGTFLQETQVSVNMFVDGTQGVAHVHDQFQINDPFGGDPGGGPDGSGDMGWDDEYVVAFDDVHLLRAKVGEEEKCLDRTQFQKSVWRYNLYHADGDDAGGLVQLNSGFGFRTEDDYDGWAGYWGIYAPDEAQLADGDLVTEFSYDDFSQGSDPTQYEVVMAPGTLWHMTRQELPLASVDGEVFEWWSFPFWDGQGDPPQPETYHVEYTDVDGLFTRREIFDPETGFFDPLPEQDQTPIDLDQNPWLDLWSPSLGGNVNYVQGSDVITFFQQEIVNGSNGVLNGQDLPLYGFVQCLAPDVLASQASVGDVFLDDAFDVEQPYRYVFQADDLGLYYDGAGDGSNLQTAGLATGETYQGGPNDWGMRSGPLVTFESLSGLGQVWDIWDVPEYFEYETGPNPWNRYTTLKEVGGDFVTFDPPLQFPYVHSQENDLNGDPTFAGKTYQVEYNGPGELWGIPFQGKDTDGDGWEDRWYPLFSLADGVLVDAKGSSYVVRAVDTEQTLLEVPGQCGNLTTGPVLDLTLPDGGGYQFPDIGDKPVVDAPPAVVAGEVQIPLDD